MSATLTIDEKAQQRAKQLSVRAQRAEARQQSEKRTRAHYRLTLQLLAVSDECPCCGATMDHVGVQAVRPHLVERNGSPSLICLDCYKRIAAVCEQRARDTGGLLGLPIIDDAGLTG
ncbi:MAG: hypothetical protein SH850_22115 [Planctomycetaceae bacterium]|nr:hypothetical protein [Planctomycetaceae bacterium]